MSEPGFFLTVRLPMAFLWGESGITYLQELSRASCCSAYAYAFHHTELPIVAEHLKSLFEKKGPLGPPDPKYEVIPASKLDIPQRAIRHEEILKLFEWYQEMVDWYQQMPQLAQEKTSVSWYDLQVSLLAGLPSIYPNAAWATDLGAEDLLMPLLARCLKCAQDWEPIILEDRRLGKGSPEKRQVYRLLQRQYLSLRSQLPMIRDAWQQEQKQKLEQENRQAQRPPADDAPVHLSSGEPGEQSGKIPNTATLIPPGSRTDMAKTHVVDSATQTSQQGDLPPAAVPAVVPAGPSLSPSGETQTAATGGTLGLSGPAKVPPANIVVDLVRKDDGWHWIVDGKDTGRIADRESRIIYKISHILFDQIGHDWVPHRTFYQKFGWNENDYFDQNRMQKHLSILRKRLKIKIDFKKAHGVKFPNNIVKPKSDSK